MPRKVKVEVGSGNIFADLGLPDADTHFLNKWVIEMSWEGLWRV
jgi:hypothetical protein